jgi:hypothetical protein
LYSICSVSIILFNHIHMSNTVTVTSASHYKVQEKAILTEGLIVFLTSTRYIFTCVNSHFLLHISYKTTHVNPHILNDTCCEFIEQMYLLLHCLMYWLPGSYIIQIFTGEWCIFFLTLLTHVGSDFCYFV